MKRSTMKKQRRVLRGWVKWVPVVAIPFSILFFHTWLNIQILRADYVLRELDGEAREWADRLNHTGVAETIHEDPAMLAEQAEQLAFVQPSPGQREIIYFDPNVPLVAPEDANIAVAQREGGSESNPVATESLSDQSIPVPAPPVEGAYSATLDEEPAIELPAVESVSAVSPANIPEAVFPAAVPVAQEAAETVVTGAALETPEAPAVEEVVDLESAMESLESL
ncbi:MAG: hypothetical protein JNK74_21625 [Candidatus Hydrogenedentes bacterium]|nr:hypothetical protein [Candidatus Hydrogenedentota bacterium]